MNTRSVFIYTVTILIILSGCATKFFPDKTLYQYPAKPNEVAVVYPDGSIHHTDGSISSGEKLKPGMNDEENSTPTQTQHAVEEKNNPEVKVTDVKNSKTRHAIYRQPK